MRNIQAAEWGEAISSGICKMQVKQGVHGFPGVEMFHCNNDVMSEAKPVLYDHILMSLKSWSFGLVEQSSEEQTHGLEEKLPLCWKLV